MPKSITVADLRNAREAIKEAVLTPGSGHTEGAFEAAFVNNFEFVAIGSGGGLLKQLIGTLIHNPEPVDPNNTAQQNELALNRDIAKAIAKVLGIEGELLVTSSSNRLSGMGRN